MCALLLNWGVDFRILAVSIGYLGPPDANNVLLGIVLNGFGSRQWP